MSDGSSASLSSDILEEQFGPTSIRVIEHGPGRRVISTIADGQALEFSLVTFRAGADTAFPEAYRDMQDGTSMGKAFRGRGLPFRRHVRGVYAAEPPESFRGRFGVGGKVTVVEVSVTAGPDALPYADILEIYSPEVDWPRPGLNPSASTLARLKEFDRLLTELYY